MCHSGTLAPMETSATGAKRVVGRPFQKGQAHPRWGKKGSGNGRGSVPRLSDGRQLWQLFRDYTEDAARLLAAVMNDRREDMELRVRAAAMILQRGWGDAPKHLMLSPLTDMSRASELTEADIVAMMRSPAAPLPVVTLEPMKESPPSAGDEAGTPSGTGPLSPSPKQPIILDLPPLVVPDIPSFLPKDTPPTSEGQK